MSVFQELTRLPKVSVFQELTPLRTNRGHDSIAVFAINDQTGQLKAIDHTPTGGKTPRNFAIDPTGMWLIAANQDSNDFRVFKIDPASGKLVATPHSAQVGAPVCVIFPPRN